MKKWLIGIGLIILILGGIFLGGCGRHIWAPNVDKAVSEHKQVQTMKADLIVQKRIATALERIAMAMESK